MRWVYEEIPVFRASLALTMILPANALVAFFISRGEYQSFRGFGVFLGVMMPIVVIAAVLPGALDTPAHLGSRMGALVYISIGAQLVFSRCLVRQVWEYGGRTVTM
jgi:hypothetical protein